MTPQQIEALKLALEALEELNINASDYDFGPAYEGAKQRRKTAITSLRQAIAEAEQEPVAWFSTQGNLYQTRFHAVANGEQAITPLYTHPQPKAEQEPVMKVVIDGGFWMETTLVDFHQLPDGEHGLYAHPQPKREWVGLTDEALVAVAQSCLSPHQYEHFEALLENDPDAHNRLARAIEAKLKEKNT